MQELAALLLKNNIPYKTDPDFPDSFLICRCGVIAVAADTPCGIHLRIFTHRGTLEEWGMTGGGAFALLEGSFS